MSTTASSKSVLGLFDSGRIETGTHGDVRAWISEVYAAGGIAAVAEAITKWPTAFVGIKGVYVGVSEWEAILVAPLALTDEEVEQAAFEATNRRTQP